MSLLAIILTVLGLVVPLALMVFVWKIISNLETDDRGDDGRP
ncbi:MAG: hypothetical protein R3229_03615 [Alphaproteobacteria bacterium]|nr:hypothetical protein [Alphaproteobacteria bacterium]